MDLMLDYSMTIINQPNENVYQVAVPGDHDVLRQREAMLTGSENTMVLSYYFVLEKH
jgi:hypothetical protein